MKKKYPEKTELLIAYRRLVKKLEKQPTIDDFSKYCHPQSTVFRIFGEDGWRKLVEAAGGTIRKPYTGSLTAEHLIEDFLNLQKKLGRRPKLSEYLSQCHTPKVLDMAFGSPGWRNMLNKLDDQVMNKGINEEQLILEYLSLRKGIGRNPTQYQFIRRHHHSFKLLVRIFGSRPWNKLIAASEAYESKKNDASYRNEAAESKNFTGAIAMG